jgi:phage tail tape-measure protein
MTEEQFKAAAADNKKENDKNARMAGAGAGVLAGAQLGTVLLPIPVVGTFTGALVGGLIGTKIGKRIGGVILDKMEPVEESLTASGSAPRNKTDVTQELERLAQLRAAGVLDEDEFKAAKAKLLGL